MLIIFLISAIILSSVPRNYHRNYGQYFSIKFSLLLWFIPILIVSGITFVSIFLLSHDVSGMSDSTGVGIIFVFYIPVMYILAIVPVAILQSTVAKRRLRFFTDNTKR